MPIEKRTRGSGITEREIVDLNDPDSEGARKFSEQEFTFEGLCGKPLEEKALRIFADAGFTYECPRLMKDGRRATPKDYEEDGPVDFPLTILNEQQPVRKDFKRDKT